MPCKHATYEAVWVCVHCAAVWPTDVMVFYCRLARPHQLFFSGTVKGESAMTSLEDIGSPVDFEFVVRRDTHIYISSLWRCEIFLLSMYTLHFITVTSYIFPLRLLIPAKPCRRSAQPSSTSCGLTSWPMKSGSCIPPAWSLRVTQTHSAPQQGPWILWSCTAPHLQNSHSLSTTGWEKNNQKNTMQ